MKIQEQVELGPLTTLGVGGPARWLIEAVSETEIAEAVNWARSKSVPLFVLGGGSNLVVSDVGFAGLVLKIGLKGIVVEESADARVYHVAAGENWDGFVERTVQENCAGIECLAGIPGTVGGTPVQNVGAYGQEVSETIKKVRVLDLETFDFREMPTSECGFAYRRSIFNSTAKGRYLVTRVDYRLMLGGAACLRYVDLKQRFALESQPTLAQVAAVVREVRRSKGMLLVDGDADCKSAGSFFKNPVLSDARFASLTAELGMEPPHYPGGQGCVKLPAAWLIEKAGFAKGFSIGRAGISSRHTLALVNRGGATTADLFALRDAIAAGVEAKFGIALEMEPVLVGF